MPYQAFEESPRWDGPNRRKPTRMTELVEDAVKEAMEEHEEKVRQHLDARFNELKAIMLSAFPDGDPIGHRQYHQKQIDYMNERIALWRDIRNKSVVGTLWLLGSFIAMAAWEYIKRQVQK